jgi:hypothetical protein
VDPQLGITSFTGVYQATPAPGLGNSADSLAVLARNIVFLNRNGVYVSYGGSVTKVSDALDGLNLGVPVNGSVNSTAVANIFGVEVFMFLASCTDTYTSAVKNKIFMWDGKKWFTSDQNWPNGYQTPRFIASDPFFNAYATDGQYIWPMFKTASSSFTKVLQSKLWDAPAIYFKKTVTQVFATVYVNTADSTTNSLYVDSNPDSPTESTACTSTNAVTGLYVFTNPVNFFGQYIGTTFKTTAADITLIEIVLFGNIQQSLVR